MSKKNKIVIFSLGGSLIFKNDSGEINIDFLKKFKKFILNFLRKEDYFFIIVVGGGFLAKSIIQAAKKLNKNLTFQDFDNLGIKTTELNALFFKTVFKDLSYFKILNKPIKDLKNIVLNKKILFVYGLKPGHSTDFVSVFWAKTLKVDKVINLTNVDYIYDRNPAKFKKNTPIFKMTLKDYLKKIANFKWQPKLSLPFDPIAAKLALKEKIKIITVNGNDFKNLKNVILEKEFKGSELIF